MRTVRQEVVGSSGVMGTLTILSVSGTNMAELEDRDLSLCPNLVSLNLRHILNSTLSPKGYSYDIWIVLKGLSHEMEVVPTVLSVSFRVFDAESKTEFTNISAKTKILSKIFWGVDLSPRYY